MSESKYYGYGQNPTSGGAEHQFSTSTSAEQVMATYVDFNSTDVATSGITPEVGRVHWNDDDQALNVHTGGSTKPTLQVGQEQWLRVRNNTGATLPNGCVVYVNGAQGNRPTVTSADVAGESLSSQTIGILTEEIANNGNGFCTTFGLVRGVDTAGLVEGDPLYLSTSGTYTTTRPTSPNHEVRLGNVIFADATDGIIFTSVNNGWELYELHDVDNLVDNAKSLDGYYIKSDSVSGLWTSGNFNDDVLATGVLQNLQSVTDRGATTSANVTVGTTFTISNGNDFAEFSLFGGGTSAEQIFIGTPGAAGTMSLSNGGTLKSALGTLQFGDNTQPINDMYYNGLVDKGSDTTNLKILAKDTANDGRVVLTDVSAVGSGGQVDSITSSDGNIDIDSSDPANPDINLFRFPNNKLASDAPDTYPEGYSYGLNTGSGGFPDTFGTHQTFKSADNTGYQTYTATNSNQQWLRTITASNTWGSFTEITAGLGAPLNSVLAAGNTTGSTAVNYSSFSNSSPSNGDVNRDTDEELVYRRSGRNMGLIGSDRAVSTITNMNSLTLAGFYVTTNSGLTNIPTGWAVNYLHMLVIRHEPTSGAITQIAYNVGESGTAGSKTAIRNSFNGGSSWTSWAELEQKPTLSKTFTLEAPTSADDVTIFRTDVAITVQEVIAVSTGTTPSTTYQLKHSTDRSSAGNALTNSGATTSTTSGDTATLSDATIPVNSWVWYESTAASGTGVTLSIDIRYTED